jgi:hypothetical protein
MHRGVSVHITRIDHSVKVAPNNPITGFIPMSGEEYHLVIVTGHYLKLAPRRFVTCQINYVVVVFR